MKSSDRRTDFLITALITLVIGGLCTLGINRYLTADHRWFQIVSPASERITDILAVNRLLRVYVRTEQGNLYLCGGRTWRDACEPVKETQVPAHPLPARWQTCTSGFPEPPLLAGEVVDSIQMGQCFEGKTYAQIRVLSDGTMWQWQRTYSWVNTFALLSGALASLSIGAAIGWVVPRTRRYLREPVGGAQPHGGMR